LKPAILIGDADAHAAASGLMQEVERLIQAGDRSLAAQRVSHAIAMARRCDDVALLGRSLISLGQLEYQASRHLTAYAAASEAFRLFGQCGDITLQLRALTLCTGVHAICGDTARSVELLRRGLAMTAGSIDPVNRCALLYNLAVHLGDCDEYREAIYCLSEAVETAEQSPQMRFAYAGFAAKLSATHLAYSKHLGRQGRHAEAQEQLKAAASRLPPLSQGPRQTLSRYDAYCFNAQATVFSELGQWNAARRAAAMGLRFGRQNAGNSLFLGWGFTVTARLHERQGLLKKSVHLENRALRLWRRVDNKAGIIEVLGHLATLHAQMGDHGQALALHKELAAHHVRQRQEAGALRCRLAAIEREAERRRRQAREAQAHAQRLALIGRLIAQTHHALSVPITQARALTIRALASAHHRAALAPLLAEINQTIDRAASLVSQLKLFSYRSSPQPMALSLHESLLDAWRGLDTHTGSSSADLRISGHTQLQVWGDAQRLGIMLKVLLIELTQQAGGAAVVIGARIAAGEAHTVLLHIEACACSTPPGAAAAPPATAPATPSLGAAMCMEIAVEMQGELQPAGNDDAVRRYRLRLPEPDAQVHPLPGYLA
jgi:tetratricopeptide (TPR) repeat protein